MIFFLLLKQKFEQRLSFTKAKFEKPFPEFELSVNSKEMRNCPLFKLSGMLFNIFQLQKKKFFLLVLYKKNIRILIFLRKNTIKE